MCALCITGAVYADDDSNALFGGEAVFANNTAEYGGTSVVVVVVVDDLHIQRIVLATEDITVT